MTSVRNKRGRNFILVSVVSLPRWGSGFDWLKQIFLKARSIRSPTQFSGSTAEAFLRLVFTSDGVGVGVVSGVVRGLMTK